MKKKLIFCITNVLLFLIAGIIGHTNAESIDFFDFPSAIETTYDIRAALSIQGDRFLHVKSYFLNNFPDSSYKLYYKEYSDDNHLIRFATTPPQLAPDFHFLVDTGHYYEFCIVAMNNNLDIVGVTSVQKVIPSILFTAQQKKNYPVVNITPPTKSKIRNTQNSDLTLTLDLGYQNFPLINLTSQILFEGIAFDGSNLEKLDISNFLVKEDNRIQTIKQIFSPNSAGNYRIVDVIFVIDDSGSMSDEANTVKKTVKQFAEKFEENQVDYRIALLPYGGASFSSPDGTVLHNGELQKVDNFTNDIDKMRFNGDTECSYKAMYKALHEYQWRSDTQKLLFLITDEPDSNCGYPESDILNELSNELNLILYIVCSNKNHYIAFENDYLRSSVSGNLSSNSQDLENEFIKIFGEVNDEIINQYIIQYETDKPSIDGNCRNVDLTVNFDHPSKGFIENSVSKTYCINQILTIMLTPETEQLSKESQRKNASLTIEAMLKPMHSTITDLSSYKLNLNYASCNDNTYKTVEMIPNLTDSQLFTKVIPNVDISPPCLKYYIFASGDLGKLTFPADQPTYTPVVISVMPNTSPNIIHQPVTKAFQNTSVPINLIAEDVTDHLEKVTLFYRKKGDFIYQSITKNSNETMTQFNRDIPEQYVTPTGVQYYIVAIDNHGASSNIGSPESPLNIFVTNPDIPLLPSQTIGNVVIYADEFIQNKEDPYITRASGNVMIGTISGDTPLIKTSTTLFLHHDTRSISSLSIGDLIALNIKRDANSNPENIPLYSGNYEIDCVSNPPIINLKDGVSTLKLVQNIPFYFPSENPTISLGSDNLTIHNLTAQLSQGFILSLPIRDIILSQNGDSTQNCSSSGDELINHYSYERSKLFSISNLCFEFDLLEQSFKGLGELVIQNILGYKDKGISASFKCQQNPFSIDSIFGELKYPINTKEKVIIPASYDQGLYVEVSNAVYNFDMTEALPILTGSGEFVLNDADGIISNVNQQTQHEFIHGFMNFSLDLSGQTIFNGDMWLFDQIHLKNGKLKFDMSHKISGDINIKDILKGHIDLSVSKSMDYVEITGLNALDLNIPLSAPWIGGFFLQNQIVYPSIRLSSKGLLQSYFESNYNLFFINLGIRLNIDPGAEPYIQIMGWKDISSNHPITTQNKTLTFKIDKTYDQLVIVANCDKQTADFNISLPDGQSYSPLTVSPYMGNDSEFSITIDNIFFMKNSYIHESYYAINTPQTGEYTITLNNTDNIGSYQIKLMVPDDLPSIQLEQTSGDVTLEAGQFVPIQWQANDMDDNADISLYLDKDASGANGFLIQTNLKEDSNDNTYKWEVTDDIPAGTYYLYAAISDKKHAPTFSYSPNILKISKEGMPTTPEYVVALPQEWGTQLYWNPVQNTEIMGYRVRVSDVLNNNTTLEYDIGVGTDTSYALAGLKKEQSYEVAVSVVDSQGRESELSQSVAFVSKTDGDGGNPDLILDTETSSLTYEPLLKRLKVSAQIKNIGNNDAYSAKISCYYGPVRPENYIETQMIPQLSSSESLTVSFYIEEQSAFKGGNDIYITIGEVQLQEIDTHNNIGVICNDTLFSAQNGFMFLSKNGYILEIATPRDYTITQLKSIFHKSITETNNEVENFPYDLIDMAFKSSKTAKANVGIIFPRQLPDSYKLYSHSSAKGWKTLTHTAEASQSMITVTFTDNNVSDSDPTNLSIKSIFGLAVIPETQIDINQKSEDSSSCFISILKNN